MRFRSGVRTSHHVRTVDESGWMFDGSGRGRTRIIVQAGDPEELDLNSPVWTAVYDAWAHMVLITPMFVPS
jgi:hypothetical protein